MKLSLSQQAANYTKAFLAAPSMTSSYEHAGVPRPSLK